MRTLVVGAGAIGGYFGGRLLDAGQDVTFLVRERRATELAKSGLVIHSRFGDVTISNPTTVLAKNLNEYFDLVLLSCKAYDLEDAIQSFAQAVGPNTAILPLLNGMHHLDILDARFGQQHVLGGQCLIAVTLNASREIVHLNDTHDLAFGERNGVRSVRVQAIESIMAGAKFASRLSENILQEMWAKWVFIASGAGLTCLMRASVGDIVEAGEARLATALLQECSAIATAEGFAPNAAALERSTKMLTQPGSTLTASMLRDIEQGARIEADHVIGDMLKRGERHSVSSPLLRVVYAHLKAYEARRKRETQPTSAAVN